MMLLLKRLKITLLVALTIFLLQSPLLLSQYSSSNFSNHIVESFGSIHLLRQRMPLKQLEKEWNNKVDGIYYLVDPLESSYNILSNEYGLRRWEYLKQKLSINSMGLTLNIVDEHSYWMGWGGGETTEEKNKYWIKEISSLISKSKSKLHIAQKSALIDIGPYSYQVTFNINWETLPDRETLSRYRYLLFLVADEVHKENLSPCIGSVTFENVAYDFIPLEGDNPKTFDGSGLPLESSNRKISPEDSIMELKTATFKLPEIERDTGWSLHLILEDPENLGKTIFSYKIRLF